MTHAPAPRTQALFAVSQLCYRTDVYTFSDCSLHREFFQLSQVYLCSLFQARDISRFRLESPDLEMLCGLRCDGK